MKKIIVVMFALVMVANQALAFNEYGHKSAMILTNKYLTEKAKNEIKSALGGSTMVKEAVWLNTLRKSEATAYTKNWHFFRLDENGKSTTKDENDGVVVVERSIEVLRNRAKHTPAEVKDALRTVIHLVVDMHTLSHIRIDGIHETNGFDFFHWNEGEGKASDLYIGLAYCMTPYLIAALPLQIITNVLVQNESFVYDFPMLLVVGWSAILFFMMVKEMHNYSFKDTVKNLAITLFTIFLFLLIGFIVYLLYGQLSDFVVSIVQEVAIRG